MSRAVFQNELYDMTETARELIARDLDLPADAQVEEFPYGKGATYRTDIAAVRRRDDAIETRRERFGHLKPLNSVWKRARGWIRLRLDLAPCTKPVFLAEGPYNAGSVWDWLGKNNYLEYERFGEPADLADVPFHGDQFAIELKQRDWEQALYQASRSVYGTDPQFFEDRKDDCRDDVLERNDGYPWRHGGYADFAIVVMDAGYIDAPLEHTDQFRDLGVGLASLDRDDLVFHVDPQRQDPFPFSRNRLDLNERTLPDSDSDS